MKRIQRSVVSGEFSRGTGHLAPQMDSRQSLVKLSGRLKVRIDHHSSGCVNVPPLPINPYRDQVLKEVPNLVEAGGDDKFPRFVNESPFSFGQCHGRQTMEEV